MDVDDPRSIRVFISSTFRDMQLERDELVKRVFPQVRRVCERRGVAWGEIDLRWGVTDEQKAEGAVLPICLAEIERTRPYFIGLLGQRYGWVPDELPGRLVHELEWLDDDHGRSVTELEILHGVLNSSDAGSHAYFYLRDPAWVDTQPADQRSQYLEESDTGLDRLAELRDRVRASGYPCRDYPDPVALGDLVLADLLALVDERYPEGSQPDPLDRDAAVHASFAAARHAGFVPRPALSARLDQHFDAATPPLLVTGESGIGASALVATWATGRRRAGDAVVEHHVEAGADAADPTLMVTRIVGELARHRGESAPSALSDDPVVLRGALGQAFDACDRRTIVVLDGVDRLRDVDRSPDLRWLPENVAPLVRVVLVASGERPKSQVEHRGWPVLTVPPLDETERRAVATTVLARWSKALDEMHLAALVSSPRTGNARYLRIVLDELRQHGDHFTLGRTIAHLCSPATVDDLYELVLERYERDFERDRPGLTRDVFSALWAARRGLTEAELLDLMGDDERQLPQAVWSPLHLAAERGIVDRVGVLGLADDDLRRAVADRYLPDIEQRRLAHARLAGYFVRQELSDRVVDELTWQQIESDDLDGLADTLADLDHTELAHTRASTDLRRAWAHASRAGRSMVDTYRAVIDHPAAHDGEPGSDRQLVWAISRLLTDAGHPAEALSVQRFLVERARLAPAGRSGTGDARLRAALVNLGATQWTQGLHADAVVSLTEAVDRCRAAVDPAMLASALGNLAMAQRDLGDHAAADDAFDEEAGLCRQLHDEFGLQASLGNRAQLLRQIGRPDEALDALREQEHLCRGLADPAGIARSLAGQAAVLADRGDVATAIELTAEHARLSREEGDVRGLVEALLNLTVMQAQAGALPAALAAADEGEATARRLADPSLLARVLVARASALSGTGQWTEVERVAREAELTARQADLPAQVALALGVIGTARREQGDLAGSRTTHDDELAIAVTLGDPQAVATAHTNLGTVAIAEQRFDDALAHYDVAEPLLRSGRVLSGLVPMLANRGQVHHALGRHDRALADLTDAALSAAVLGLHSVVIQWGEPATQLAAHLGEVSRLGELWEALAGAARAIDDHERLQQALGEHALVLIGRAQPTGVPGDATNVDHRLLEQASALLDEQEAICRRIDHQIGLAACVGNRAIVLRYLGDLDGSLGCLDEQLRLAQESGNGQGVLFATANRGEVLGLLGRVPEALESLNWARAVAAQNGIAPMVQQLDAMIAALQHRN